MADFQNTTQDGTRVVVVLHPGFTKPPAIERVLALARHQICDVLLYSAVYDRQLSTWQSGVSEPETLEALMTQRELDSLNKAKSELVGVCRSVDTCAQWEPDIAQGVAEAARRFKADFVIASSARHTALARLALTHTDWEILRCASSPVLFAQQREFRPYSKVLVAVDPSPLEDGAEALDDQLIINAQKLCRSFNGTVHLVHAYPSGKYTISMKMEA